MLLMHGVTMKFSVVLCLQETYLDKLEEYRKNRAGK